MSSANRSPLAARALAIHVAGLLLVACTAAPSSGGSHVPSGSSGPGSTAEPLESVSPSSSPAPTPADPTVAAGLALVRPVAGVDQVFVIDEEGNARQVSNLSGGAVHPLWSPDRSQIAFAPRALGAGLDPQQWVVNADGSDQRALGSIGEQISWSSDSTRLLFMDSVWTTDNSGQPPRIWLLDVESGERTPLVQGSAPRWLPDGSYISYLPYPDVSPGDPLPEPQVLILAVDGGEPSEFTEADDVWWSPDGEHVLLLRGSELYLADASAGGARLLASGRTPEWSPDGSLIAYTSNDPDSGDFVVGMMSPDGTDLWGPVPGTDPAWSPDGSRVAVQVGITDLAVQVLDATNGAVLWELEGAFPDW